MVLASVQVKEQSLINKQAWVYYLQQIGVDVSSKIHHLASQEYLTEESLLEDLLEDRVLRKEEGVITLNDLITISRRWRQSWELGLL